MMNIELFLRGLEEEKDKMVTELAVLNGRRDQLRDDINRFNFAIAAIKADIREQENGKEKE